VPADPNAHRTAPAAVIRIEVATDERGRARLDAGRRVRPATARLYRHLFHVAAIQRLRRRVAARRSGPAIGVARDRAAAG
jgi:hypothetical protein